MFRSQLVPKLLGASLSLLLAMLPAITPAVAQTTKDHNSQVFAAANKKPKVPPAQLIPTTKEAEKLAQALSSMIKPDLAGLSASDLTQRAAESTSGASQDVIVRLSEILAQLRQVRQDSGSQIEAIPFLDKKLIAKLKQKLPQLDGEIRAGEKQLADLIAKNEIEKKGKTPPKKGTLSGGRFAFTKPSEKGDRISGSYTTRNGTVFAATLLRDKDTWVALIRTKAANTSDVVAKSDTKDLKALGFNTPGGVGGTYEALVWPKESDPKAAVLGKPIYQSSPLGADAVVKFLGLAKESDKVLGAGTLPAAALVALAMQPAAFAGGGRQPEPERAPPPAPGPTTAPACANASDFCSYQDPSTGAIITTPCCATDADTGQLLDCLGSSSSNPNLKRCYRRIPTRTPTPTPAANPLGCDVNSCIPGGIGGPCTTDSDCRIGPTPISTSVAASCESKLATVACGACQRGPFDPNGPFGANVSKGCPSGLYCRYDEVICTTSGLGCCNLTSTICPGTCIPVTNVGLCSGFSTRVSAGQCASCFTAVLNVWQRVDKCSGGSVCDYEAGAVCEALSPIDGTVCNGSCPTPSPTPDASCNGFNNTWPPPGPNLCEYCYGTDSLWRIGRQTCDSDKVCMPPTSNGSPPPQTRIVGCSPMPSTPVPTTPVATPSMLGGCVTGLGDAPRCLPGIASSRGCNTDFDCQGFVPATPMVPPA